MSWKAIAHSAPGTSHINRKIPCQDCGDWRVKDDWIVGAVSDGSGSAKYSDKAAQIAVQVALERMQSQSWNSQPSEKEAKAIFTEVGNEVLHQLKIKANEINCALRDLSCTLLLFIATPTWLSAMQIGDGLIVVRQNQDDYKLIFMPDKGEFVNETNYITTLDNLTDIKVCVKAGNHKFICVSTDGLEKVSICYQDNWRPFNGFFKSLENYMRSKNNLAEDNELISFLNSDKLNAETDDDKTLLLCLYED